MENLEKRIIEINGIKMEVDLRHAKRIDSFKVGDSVKVLVKKYNDYEPHIGVIVGFDEFQKLPTMTVAYVVKGYSDVEMKFIGINDKTEEIEICPLNDYDNKFSFDDCVNTFNKQIENKEDEMREIRNKKNWFTKNYNHYFKDFENVNIDD